MINDIYFLEIFPFLLGPKKILQRLKVRLPKLEPPLTHSAVRAPLARLVACGSRTFLIFLTQRKLMEMEGANEKI